MTIIALLQKIEHAIVSYADATGKDIEHIGKEILEFIKGKNPEHTNEDAKASGVAHPDSGAVASTGTTGASSSGDTGGAAA